LHGLNSVGLRRRGLADAAGPLKQAYRVVFQSGLKVAEAIARLRQDLPDVPEVERFAAFIEGSERGVCR
jgi:UDP-N-acetylglucosamine acyltransferase